MKLRKPRLSLFVILIVFILSINTILANPEVDTGECEGNFIYNILVFRIYVLYIYINIQYAWVL